MIEYDWSKILPEIAVIARASTINVANLSDNSLHRDWFIFDPNWLFMISGNFFFLLNTLTRISGGDDEAPNLIFSKLHALKLIPIHVTTASRSTTDWKRSWYVFKQENSLK